MAEPPFQNVNRLQFGSTFWPEMVSFSNQQKTKKCSPHQEQKNLYVFSFGVAMTLIVFQLTAEPPFKNVNKFQFGSTFWPEKASFSNPIENREKCQQKTK